MNAFSIRTRSFGMLLAAMAVVLAGSAYAADVYRSATTPGGYPDNPSFTTVQAEEYGVRNAADNNPGLNPQVLQRRASDPGPYVEEGGLTSVERSIYNIRNESPNVNVSGGGFEAIAPARTGSEPQPYPDNPDSFTDAEKSMYNIRD